MKPDPWPPASDISANGDHVSGPLITIIRQNQMPQDIRSEFLPQDVVLICEPRGKNSAISHTLAQAREHLSPVDPKCTWCWADDVCSRLAGSLLGLLLFGVTGLMDWGTCVSSAFGFCFAALILILTPLSLVQRAIPEHDSLSLVCHRSAESHHTRNLAQRILCPSSLFLLQHPVSNARSFFRYHKFHDRRQSSEPAEWEIDSCIRAYAATGQLAHAGLIDDGLHALLGLEPCRETPTHFEWAFGHIVALQRNYRDWKRWRLAALVCRQLGDPEIVRWRNGGWDDSNSEDSLEGLGDGRVYKWLLVDPYMFPSRLPLDQEWTRL